MCEVTQVNLQGIIGCHKDVGYVHHWVQRSWHPEEKPAIGTCNPSILVQNERNTGVTISLQKGGGGTKGMDGIG